MKMKAGTTAHPYQKVNEDYMGDLNFSRFLKALLFALVMYIDVVLRKGWKTGDFF